MSRILEKLDSLLGSKKTTRVRFPEGGLKAWAEARARFPISPVHVLIALLFLGVLAVGLRPFLRKDKLALSKSSASSAFAELEESNNRAVALLKAAKIPEALAEFSRLVILAPKNPQISVNLALAFKKSGDVKKAREFLIRAVALDPADATAHNNLGLVELESGLAASAEAHLEKSLSLNPKSNDILLNLARAHEAAGHFAQAMEGYSHYVAQVPNLPANTKSLLTERLRRLQSLAMLQKKPEAAPLTLRKPASPDDDDFEDSPDDEDEL